MSSGTSPTPALVLRPGSSEKSEIERFAPFIRPQIEALFDDTHENYAITDITSTTHPLSIFPANAFTVTIQRLHDLPPITLRFKYSLLFPEREPDIEIEDDDASCQAAFERASDPAYGPKWASRYRAEEPKSLSRLISMFRRARARSQFHSFGGLCPSLFSAFRQLMGAPVPDSPSRSFREIADYEFEEDFGIVYVDISHVHEAYVEIKARGGEAEKVVFNLRISTLLLEHLLEEEREYLSACLKECNDCHKNNWVLGTSSLFNQFRKLQEDVELRVQYRMQFVNVFVSENCAVSWDTAWFDWLIVNVGPIGVRDIARTSFYVALPNIATEATCDAIAIGRSSSSIVFEGEEFAISDSAQARAHHVLSRLSGMFS